MAQLVQPQTATLKQYSSVALTTGSQVQSTEIVNPKGDVTALDFELSVTSVGTLSSPTPVTSAIQNLSVIDKNGKTILNVLGTDLPKIALWLSPDGAYVSPGNNATSAVTWNVVIPIAIKLADQPAKVQVTFAPYSALASSGATGGTISLTLNMWYGSASYTTRIYKRTLTLNSGDNAFGYQLVDGINTQIMGFTIGTEGNMNNISFSNNGNIYQYNRLLPQQIINLENEVYRDQHQTGIFNMFVAPFVYDISKSVFSVNAGSSDTLNVFQIGSN